MRILLLNQGFLPHSGQLANALVEGGDEVLYITCGCGWDFTGVPDPKSDFREFLDPRVSLEWIPIPSNTTPLTLAANIRFIAQMVKTIQRFDPDVIHVHDMADYRYLATVARVRSRYPIVMSVHNAEPHVGKKDNRMEFLRPWLRRMPDLVIVHGEHIKRRLLSVTNIFAEDRLYVIPVGSYMYHRKWLTGQADDGKTVLFFGGITRYKGLEYLIRATPLVSKHVPDARFLIAGSGADWPRCKAMIQNPESFILREGRLTNPEVTEIFEQSSVVVLPYIEASQSGVMAVAYALGKPVIVTNVGSLPEVVAEGETGLIVPPADVDALAKAIIRILADTELCRAMGDKAYERASVGDLTWTNVAAKTREVYVAAIKIRKGKR